MEWLKKDYPHLLEEPKEETVKEIETEQTE